MRVLHKILLYFDISISGEAAWQLWYFARQISPSHLGG